MAKDADYYARGLARLIQIPTVVTEPPEVFARYHATLGEVFPHVFSTVEITKAGASDAEGDMFLQMAKRIGGISDPRFQSANPKGGNALILRWKGKASERPIALMGHQDVAPVEEENWTYPPFEGRVVDGKLYGRGAIDCKNTAYLSLQAMEELIEEGFVPEQDIYFLSSDNEEMAGQGTPSSIKILQERGVHFSIVLDEGGAISTDLFAAIKKPIAAVAVMEKGSSVFRFSAKSHGGHTSMPPKNTPWERLARLMVDVHSHPYFKPKATPEVIAMLEGLSGAMEGAAAFLLRHAKWFKPVIQIAAPKINPTVNAMLSTVVTFTMCEGSTLPNVIPNEAFIIANLRHSTHSGVAHAQKIFARLAKKYDVEQELVFGYDATPPVKTENPGYQYVAKTIKEVMPDVTVVPFIQTGGTDSRHTPAIADAALRFTPFRITMDQMGRMHGDDENIDIATLPEGVAFFKQLIRNYR
ncbi:MAG: M20/M25/M40 family metallo-hydrolase [Oscillospiraceae bacterium]|nr:M20/M25/M40 family metallo-hydrolase [Oscillospiraceae bacterium]